MRELTHSPLLVRSQSLLNPDSDPGIWRQAGKQTGLQVYFPVAFLLLPNLWFMDTAMRGLCPQHQVSEVLKWLTPLPILTQTHTGADSALFWYSFPLSPSPGSSVSHQYLSGGN